MADVILDAKMSNDELLNSIDKTLGSAENKFNSFVKDVNEKLNTIGSGMAANLSTMLNNQLTAMENRVKQLQTNIDNAAKGTSNNGGTVSVKVEELQKAAEYAKNLAESMGTAKKNAKDLNAQFADLALARQQTKEEKVNLEVLKRQRLLQQERELRAKLANDTKKAANEEIKARISIGGQSYTNAMAMQANSIQQRIEKIKALQNVQKNLLVTDTEYQSKLATTNREIRNLQKANKEAAASGIQLEKRTNSLAESFKNLSKRVIFYMGLGAITGFAKQLYEVRGQYEMIERSMGALIGNFQTGSVLFNQIQAQALKSPFTVVDLAGSAKQLLAYNFAVEDVAETTKRLADISSALGVPMERLVYNLGQIKAQGVLNARDARDFANAGFAIVPMLAKLYTEQKRFGDEMVTTSQVYDMMSKKMVSYGDVLQVIDNITSEGGMFFDFQAKQAETLKGQISNLVDAWNYMLSQMGKDNEGVLKGTVSVTRELLQNWRTIQYTITGIVGLYGLYKTAQLAMNAVVGQGTMHLRGEILATKQKAAADLMRKQITIGLTDAEKAKLATMNKVTAQDYAAMLATKGLTREQIILKYAFARKNSEVRKGIELSGLLTEEEIKQAKNMSFLTLATKSLSFAFKSLGATIVASLPMLAITGTITLISKFLADAHEMAQKIDEINDKYGDLRKTVSNISVDFEATDDLGKKREELQKLIDLAKEKFNIVFDVDVSRLDANKVTAKIAEVKKEVNDAISIGETFEMSAVRTGLKKATDELGKAGTDLYRILDNNRAGTIELIKQRQKDGIATKQEAEALKELIALQGASYSAENLERMYKTYQLLGLIGDAAYKTVNEFGETMPAVASFEGFADKAKEFGFANAKVMEEASKLYATFKGEQVDAKRAFDTFLNDIRKEVDLGILSPKAKEQKITIGINAAASKVNADDYTKQMMIYWANEKFGTNIKFEADKKSLNHTQEELRDWVLKLQEWAKKNGNIALGLTINTSTTELQVAQEALQNYKDAVAKGEMLKRKMQYGTATYAEWSMQEKEIERTRKVALAAGADLSESTKVVDKALSELARSVKIEIGLINDLTNNYNKLTKAGMSSGDAIAFLGKEYKSTVDTINKTLTKYGLKKFNVADFAGRDVSQIVAFLEKQRSLLPKDTKADAYKQFDVQIEKMKVEAKTYDLSQITKSLERDLANVKESYELGIEIEADPQMGNLFTNLFNVDTSSLPKTAREAVSKMQDAVNKAINKYNQSSKNKVGIFDILIGEKGEWSNKYQIDTNSDLYKVIEKAQKSSRDLIEKNFKDTEKILDNFVSKYGSYSARLQQIEYERLTNIQKLDDLYNTESLRSTQDYVDKFRAINDGASREIAELKLNQFKNSELYVKMFENLDFVTTKTLKHIKEKLEDMKDAYGLLSPEQLKQIVEQQNKIDKELISRNPFKGLLKNIKEYIKERKTLSKKETTAQDAQMQYDRQENIVATLRQKVALDDKTHNLSKEQRASLDAQLSLEEKILEAKREQKDATSQELSKHEQLMKQIGLQMQGAADKVGNVSQALTSIRDDLKDVGVDLGDNLNDAIDGFAKASDGLSMTAKSFVTLNPFGVIAGVVKTFVGIGQTFAGLFGGNKKNEYDKLRESLDGLIEALNTSIEKQKELISSMTGNKAASYYREAIKDNEALADTYRQLARARGKDGSGWFSHSYAYRTNKRMRGDWTAISKLLGKSVGSVQDMYDLSADELELIQIKMPNAWSKLDSEIRVNLESIIETGQAAKDLQDALIEATTGLSVDTLASDFINMFTDLDTTAKDFADNFEKYMRNAIVRSIIYGEDFKKNMEDWLKTFNEFMSDGMLDKAERNILKEGYDKMVEDAQRRLAYAKDILGAGSTADLSGLQQGIQSVTETTANALEAKINSIDAQGYLRNTLLQNLIDNNDKGLGLQSEILLQMRESHQIQLSIQSILNGWSDNNGRSVRVTMIN